MLGRGAKCFAVDSSSCELQELKESLNISLTDCFEPIVVDLMVLFWSLGAKRFVGEGGEFKGWQNVRGE